MKKFLEILHIHLKSMVHFHSVFLYISSWLLKASVRLKCLFYHVPHFLNVCTIILETSILFIGKVYPFLFLFSGNKILEEVGVWLRMKLYLLKTSTRKFCQIVNWTTTLFCCDSLIYWLCSLHYHQCPIGEILVVIYNW